MDQVYIFEGSFWRVIFWVILGSYLGEIFVGNFWGHFGGLGVVLPGSCLEIY